MRDDEFKKLWNRLLMRLRSAHVEDPEDLAADIFLRLALRSSAGVQVSNREAYAMGITRHVIEEEVRRRKRRTLLMEALRRLVPENSASKEKQSQCLELCFEKLSPHDRHLLMAYHVAGVSNAADYRRLLAQLLGISEGALKSQVHRIRERLMECCRECMNR